MTTIAMPHEKMIDAMVCLEIELYDKGFKPQQFGFSTNLRKLIIYDFTLLKNKKFIDIFYKHGIII